MAVAQLPAAVELDPFSGHLQHLEAALAASLALSSVGRLQYSDEYCQRAGLLGTLWGCASPAVEAGLVWPVLMRVEQLPRPTQTICWEVSHPAMVSFQPLLLSQKPLGNPTGSAGGVEATSGLLNSPKEE